LSHLSDVIEAANQSPLNTSEKDTSSPLLQFKDEVLGVVMAGLKNASTVRPASGGIKGLLKAEDLLTDEELAFVVHSVNAVLQGDPEEWGDSRFCVVL
jgi:DNA repair/transcription protein MET18/MMS19